MPNTGFLGWAYVTGSQVTVAQGSSSMVSYYTGSAPSTVLTGTTKFHYDNRLNQLTLTGNLDVSGTLKALRYETIT